MSRHPERLHRDPLTLTCYACSPHTLALRACGLQCSLEIRGLQRLSLTTGWR